MAGLTSVPVVVVADEATTTAGQVERLVTQWAGERAPHRADPDRAGRGGRAALRVRGQYRADREGDQAHPARVDAALTVAGSGVAQAAAAEHDLDRSEAAVVAESDPAAVRLLVDAAESGRFHHVAQRLRDDRPRAERREAFTAGLRADGVTG